MNKINIIGGGPAGLYFAILMKEMNPKTEIQIFERNEPNHTFGWGIVLTAGTMPLLKKCDYESYNEILCNSKQWSHVDIYHRGEKKSIHGSGYRSMSRIMLLNALQKRCQTLNIDINYNSHITNIEDVFNCDLLVGADGAQSLVRDNFKESFKPSIDVRKNKYIWLGTSRLFETMTLIFKKHTTGIFTAEAYVYDDCSSTFIAQCSHSTWSKSGFENMSNQETLDYLADVFKEELKGHALMRNRSVTWNNFPFIRNTNWVHPGVLLLGDALHTAHFSIGSGTRLALEDAIVAAKTINENDTMDDALHDFETVRRPYIERFQDVAFESLQWFENLEDVIDMDLIPFAYKVMTRSKIVNLRSLRLQDADFVNEYLSYQKANTEVH